MLNGVVEIMGFFPGGGGGGWRALGKVENEDVRDEAIRKVSGNEKKSQQVKDRI